MAFENRAWNEVGDWAFDTISDGRCFAFVGNAADDFSRLQNLMDGHADRVGRNVFEGGKPTFSDLLFATRLVKKHHVVGFGRFEIRRRIIKGQVAVFADTDQSNIDRRFQQATSSALADSFGIAGSIEEMKGSQWDFLDES